MDSSVASLGGSSFAIEVDGKVSSGLSRRKIDRIINERFPNKGSSWPVSFWREDQIGGPSKVTKVFLENGHLVYRE